MSDDWSSYWRSAEAGLEAMHAHFQQHVYHRHSHETYSFGVTENGAQAFTCRGSAHTSTTGMVMAFNPDDPHDGHAADELGFTYRMIHIGPELMTEVLSDLSGRRTGLPLFADPVVDDPALARTLLALHGALLRGAAALRRDELLTATVSALVRRAAAGTRRPTTAAGRRHPAGIAERARELIHGSYLQDLSADDLASGTSHSRFTVYRAFTSAYGMAPSDYQRQLRLRTARRLLTQGHPISEVAARTGFADQAHLTRWFSRYYGITPGGYRRATLRPRR